MKTPTTPVVERGANEHAVSNPDERLRKEALARNLCARICNERRSITELQVIDLLLGGIELHEPEYGPANVETDLRDLTDELDQELTDGLFYILLRAVKRRAARVDRLALRSGRRTRKEQSRRGRPARARRVRHLRDGAE